MKNIPIFIAHHRKIMKLFKSLITIILFLPLCPGIYAQSKNVINTADVVWDFKTFNDKSNQLVLSPSDQNIKTQTLDEKSKTDGSVCQFDGKGWLSFQPIKPTFAKESGTLAIRFFPEKSGGLFQTDQLSVVIHESGLLILVVSIRNQQGTMFREIPFDFVQLNAWHSLIVRYDSGFIELILDGEQKGRLSLAGNIESIPAGASYVGKWKINNMPLNEFPPDVVDMLFEKIFKGKIDYIAIWNKFLSDKIVSQVSGVSKILVSEFTPRQAAVKAYNDFHLASKAKDVDQTIALGLRMRKFMAADKKRPSYHLTSPMDAILDPAGAYYYNGKYHVFSYRNMVSLLAATPLAHYVSEDLVHWKDYPIAIWADSDADVYGIWLANILIDNNGTPNMLYTGLGKNGKFGILAQSHDSLLSFTNKEPVITDMVHHDGHAWRKNDFWYSLTTKQYWGRRTDDKGDGILLLKSPDLHSWKIQGEIFNIKKNPTAPDNSQQTGFTEYPYLIPFGEKYVLMTGTRPAMYWIGKFDEKTPAFIPDHKEGKLLDHLNTFHCFNPMTVDNKGPNGTPRRIIEAMHLYASGNVESVPWYGVHTIPRTLSLVGNRLIQQPVPEIEKLRGKHSRFSNITMTGKNMRTGVVDDAIELIANFSGATQRVGVVIKADSEGQNGVTIYYDPATDKFGVEGSYKRPANYPELGQTKGFLKKAADVTIRVFVDHSLFEVYVNGETFTGVFDGPVDQNEIYLFSESEDVTLKSLDIWQMNSAW